MNWIPLKTEQELQELIARSADTAQVIFKHSNRCSISSVIKDRLERKKTPSEISFYILDLINYRSLSNSVSEHFMIEHESPQILLIKNGLCLYNESHLSIRMDEIEAQLMMA